MQLFIHLLFTFMLFTTFSISFYLIYKPTKLFHISHAFTITLGAYGVYFFYHLLDLHIFISILLALIVSTLFGVLNELLFYKPLRSSSKKAGLNMLILSLGVYIVFQNLVSIFFGDDIKSLSKASVGVGNEFLGAYITDIQIITIFSSIVVFLTTLYIWKFTKFGFAIRAIATNPELSQNFGIPKNKVILFSFALGSFYAGLGGILVGFDVGITPTMGFSLLLYAIVVMIIGGIENLLGILAGAFILATVQNLTAYYIDTKWMEAITYAILILFLMIKPYGVSGEKNKKVEI